MMFNKITMIIELSGVQCPMFGVQLISSDMSRPTDVNFPPIWVGMNFVNPHGVHCTSSLTISVDSSITLMSLRTRGVNVDLCWPWLPRHLSGKSELRRTPAEKPKLPRELLFALKSQDHTVPNDAQIGSHRPYFRPVSISQELGGSQS